METLRLKEMRDSVSLGFLYLQLSNVCFFVWILQFYIAILGTLVLGFCLNGLPTWAPVWASLMAQMPTSSNPQWGTNEKGSGIMIVSSFINIHFVSLPLCTVLYVDIIPPHIICYTPISHAYASLSFVYYSMCYLSILYLSITYILLHVLISLLYLLLACLLLWYTLFLHDKGSQNKCQC
jgi:hypothetical protein